MDADDISYKTRFAKQIAILEKEDADICGCHWHSVNHLRKLIEPKLVPLEQDSILLTMTYTVPFAHGSVMIRRNFLTSHELKYTSQHQCEDYDLWSKMFFKNAKIVNLNEFLYERRVVGGSLTATNNKKLAVSERLVRKQFIKYFYIDLAKLTKSLCLDISSLTEIERVYLLLLSKKIFPFWSKSFINIIRKSSMKTIGLFVLYRIKEIA